MVSNDTIFSRIAEALLVDYSSVYYVNAVTNEYQWYSIDPEFCSLQIEHEGEDFFQNLVRDADRVVYEEDKHLFITDMSKEKLLSEMKTGKMQSIEYRLMINGQPVYHRLRLIRGVTEGNDDYFIFGVLNVDKEVRERQRTAEIEREREIFTELALGIAEHYDTLYMIDMETDHYIEFSPQETYKDMHVPPIGDDFFAESKRNVDRYVHPDDLDQVEALWRKDVLLKNLEDNTTCTANYRLIVGGKIMHCRRFDVWASDHRHVIMCVENVDKEVARENNMRQTQEDNAAYAQITERLAERYEMICFVDADSEEFTVFSAENLKQGGEKAHSGKEFFERLRADIDYAIFPDDKQKLHAFMDKSTLLNGLLYPAARQIEYRLLSGGEPLHYRLSAMYTQDEKHLLFCVENVEEFHTRQAVGEASHTDQLTGLKNRDAYFEQEKTLQANIGIGAQSGFALVACDINDLERINELQGRRRGDECIREAGKLISEVFSNSSVYRTGDDEFVVLLKEQDYENRRELFAALRERIVSNLRTGALPVIASGMAEYDPELDRNVAEVLERADRAMSAYKKRMKNGLMG